MTGAAQGSGAHGLLVAVAQYVKQNKRISVSQSVNRFLNSRGHASLGSTVAYVSVILTRQPRRHGVGSKKGLELGKIFVTILFEVSIGKLDASKWWSEYQVCSIQF